ncbi:hypothetical protein APHAL10511_002708 [Amanita phalloides]|nr:hypothetical protein APHAL10511_002708 [Amanita phalloides]
MATVTHIIYSHYDPKDRERLERETGQLEDEIQAEESWRTEPPKYKNQAPAPRFVAATLDYDPWRSAASSSRPKRDVTIDDTENDVVSWYRSLRKDVVDEVMVQRPLSTSAAPDPTSHSVVEATEKRDKNNWFIMNAMSTIHSDSPRSCVTPKAPAPAPTLADILARDPPPRSGERKYKPPVWLEIGPGNKGFAMLRRSGWNEGESLGPDVIRRKRGAADEIGSDLFGVKEVDINSGARAMGMDDMGKRKAKSLDANQVRPEDVIDLTLSDSDDSGADTDDVALDLDYSSVEDEACSVDPVVKSECVERELCASFSPEIDEDPAYGRKALLTPLATVLKSDRLGIGLKAKTVGPYKASRKRVTHNAEALAAHIRTAKEMRKKRNEMGRGRKGFEKQYRKESMRRQMMLSYMNS